MDTFIKANSRLADINTKKARENLNLMVDYLCSSLAPDKLPPLNELGSLTILECHASISNVLYTEENAILANNILKNRSNISDTNCIDGFSAIYDLNRKDLIEVSSKRFFESVAVLEHEMIHILQALNNNNPEVQYNEFLSIFGELLTLKLLSEKYNNSDIYINSLIKRCIKRMSYRIYGSYFEDEEILTCSDGMKKIYYSAYDYMIGFIFAIRLFELYHQAPDRIIKDFNLILAGKKTVKTLLSEYHISLEESETLNSFIKMIDSYRDFVQIKFGTSVHKVK